MSRLSSSIIGIIAVAGIVIGINLFADTRLANVQVDLTASHLYTLSPGTKQILAGLKEPVTLRLFYSRKLGATIPSYGTYADHVREMLLNYAALSNGKLKVEFYDPEPYSDTEDRAVGYGLQGIPVDQGGENIWFGLAGSNLEDDERTIPFFQAERERFLEFDLTKLVYELSNPKRSVIGLMTPLPMEGDARMMMMARQQGGNAGQPFASDVLLRQTNTVKVVPLDAQVIDPDIQVLLVAQPPATMSDATLYAIDQFVMRGGRLMVMVDPWSEIAAAAPSPTGMPTEDAHSDLKKLFDAWGIKYDPTQAVGDLSGAWRVRAGGDGSQAVNYVAWFSIRDGINKEDPATANLKSVTVASPGALTKADGAAIEFTPLLTTSNRSALIPTEKLRIPDPAQLLGDFKPDGQTRVVAARIRGVLKSAFTGPPALPEGVKRPDNFPEFKASTDGPANLVVVADSDILADRFWVRIADFFGQPTATPFADNGPFVANLIGTLSGGDALIGLRSRGDTNRPFTVITQMQSEAEAKYRQTQQALQKHLEEVEKQLRTLRTGGEQGKAEPVITPDQRAAIDAARTDILQTRQKLRAVQLELNRDISHLETELRVLNIMLMPALLTILAVVLALIQRARRARARA
jgi:ABC-type uncharacterized transport system involved in gliding motility auxiliary subunit